ncbi:DMT family transporter [Actinomadura oligospora]|uniref:DMT family transporter n=1 Tax=Actinomadura oligospora TaxID=111804 RepID=UPI0004B77600|nr:DMT family transporter [Actinomadura oligospora]
MVWSLLGALAAACCFGVATVLEAVAARTTTPSEGVDPRLLVRLAANVPFMTGIGLDLLGFGLELAALRSLPLFVVQAIIAAALAVTAVVAGPVLKVRLRGAEWAAVLAVCAGLALLGSSAGREGPSHIGPAFHWTLLGCALVLLVAGAMAGRLTGTARSVTLGLVAGLGFGVVALAARVLTSLNPVDLLTDPAAYALAAAGVAALLFYATALQRGSVTSTTAAMVVAETVVPAAVGVVLLGDHTRPGLGPVAATGFVVAVAATLVLARFGEPHVPEPESGSGAASDGDAGSGAGSGALSGRSPGGDRSEPAHPAG